MECEQVEILLSRYIENDLHEDEYRSVSRHLKDCPQCRSIKGKMEQLISALPDLEEEVPFFLRNRLYYIPEAAEPKYEPRGIHFKWLAATVGTIILFLNLFYFTDIFPSANKILHNVVSDIKKLAVETEALFEGIKESRDLLTFADDKMLTDLNGEKKSEKREKEKTEGG